MGRRQDYFGHQRVTEIHPPRSWPFPGLKELWLYRGLLAVLAARDVKVRYKQSVLGAAWAVLQPVTAMIIFTLVFGRLAKIPSEGYPYPIFVYAGLLPWTFFSGTLGISAGSLVSSSQLVSKVYFPRLLIPMASVGAGLLDFTISSLVLLALMAWYRVPWTPQLLMVPLLVAGVIITIVGVGAGLASLTVTYRDFRFVIPFLLQTWMFVTPVIYPTTLVPEPWRWLLRLNPMTGYVEGFRSAFLGKDIAWDGLGAAALVSVVLLMVGLMYFGATERRFADVI